MPEQHHPYTGKLLENAELGKHFTYTETRAGRPNRTTPPVSQHSHAGCNNEHESWVRMKGKASPFSRIVLTEAGSWAVTSLGEPQAQVSLWLGNFSTAVAHQSRKPEREGLAQTSALFLDISTETAQEGKEPGGK